MTNDVTVVLCSCVYGFQVKGHLLVVCVYLAEFGLYLSLLEAFHILISSLDKTHWGKITSLQTASMLTSVS